MPPTAMPPTAVPPTASPPTPQPRRYTYVHRTSGIYGHVTALSLTDAKHQASRLLGSEVALLDWLDLPRAAKPVVRFSR